MNTKKNKPFNDVIKNNFNLKFMDQIKIFMYPRTQKIYTFFIFDLLLNTNKKNI